LKTREAARLGWKNMEEQTGFSDVWIPAPQWDDAVALGNQFGAYWEWATLLNEAECLELADALERALPSIPAVAPDRPLTLLDRFAGEGREFIKMLIEYLRKVDGLEVMPKDDPHRPVPPPPVPQRPMA